MLLAFVIFAIIIALINDWYNIRHINRKLDDISRKWTTPVMPLESKEYVILPCEMLIDHLKLCDLATYGSEDENWTEINIEGFGVFREREVQGFNRYIETEIEVRMKEEPNDALRLSRFVAVSGQNNGEALHARTCGLELKKASPDASGLWTVIFSAPSLEPSIVLNHT